MGNLWSQPEEATLEPEPEPPRGPLHPYYPEGVAIPGYAPNEASVPVLIAALAAMLGSALLVASVAARRFLDPGLGGSRLAVFCWFVMCTWSSIWVLVRGGGVASRDRCGVCMEGKRGHSG